MAIELTDEEKQSVKDQYAERIRTEQEEALKTTMWEAVELLKNGDDPAKWKKISDLKDKCRTDIENL